MASSSLADNFVINYLSLGLSIVGYLIPVWVLAFVFGLLESLSWLCFCLTMNFHI